MFDTIGTPTDPEAGRRQALASLLAGLLVGAGGTFVLAVGAWTAREVLAEPPVDTAPIAMVELDEPQLDVAPPPVRKGGGSDARRGSEDVAPEPIPVEVPVELKRVSDTPVRDAAVAGTTDGTGDDDTTVDAPRGSGRPDGTLGGTGTGSPITHVHRSEVTLLRQAQPDFPRGMEHGDACRVTVDIGEKGRPERIAITGCAAPFEAETRAAIERWRWARTDSGKRTTYRVVFRAR
jgi:hypothetical protein